MFFYSSKETWNLIYGHINTSVCDTHIFDIFITYCRRVLQSKENGMFYHKLKPDEIWKPPKGMSNEEAEKISKCDFI